MLVGTSRPGQPDTGAVSCKKMLVGTSGYMLGFAFRNELFTLLVPNYWEKVFLDGESETATPLLTSAASAPWGPSHASGSMLHTKSFPRQRILEGVHHH